MGWIGTWRSSGIWMPIQSSTILGRVMGTVGGIEGRKDFSLEAIPQRTVKRPAETTGIALHTGNRVTMRFLPAPPDHGIVFVRCDHPEGASIPACVDHVVGVNRGTTLRNGTASVHTVEHVLAALSAFGITNVRVELTASEPPIGDGSSAPYLELLEQAGVEDQPGTVPILVIEEPVYYEHRGTNMIILPGPKLMQVSCTIAFPTPALPGQYLSLDVTAHSFARELARARTFCLYEELEPLMRAGLIQGGSLDNAVVIRDGAIFSREGLRYPDEFVRHKILDIVGDLALLQQPIQGHIIAIKPGHAANVELARRIKAAAKRWTRSPIDGTRRHNMAGLERGAAVS
ncbi:MAG TPA: UDP-3-O-[3-hydroxymyristoyl] N-acetylglucosamine deacetylase [Verrucomicrobia bacterium]|nr:UDP-3-O-[3-hydroxymyristoyl] N-acetylglucosamine deacetylase [Verrucomicrobiota bacterium]